MAIDPKKNKNLKEVRQRRYLARDFDSLRATLLDYARQYYPSQIQDFSESSVGGLFLDMASYVGDNLSFYLDHLYGELNYETAVETDSIQRALINAGIPVNGAAPASVEVTIFLEASVKNPGDKDPNIDLLPVIREGTSFGALGGIKFTLVEDVDFIQSPNKDGNYIVNPKAEKKIGKVRPADGKVLTYILAMKGVAVSGEMITETFNVGSFQPFRTITLQRSNVTEIVRAFDDFGNNYYEVGALTHDVVYRNIANTSSDKTLVKDSLRVIPAPYRFTKSTALANRLTTLTFGGGNANTLEDDVIPDPSEFAISFPYSKTISRVPVNPEKLLTTRTLGVAASDTQLTIIYRYGGGLKHNVGPGSIGSIFNLEIDFPKNPPANDQARIRNTLDVTNFERAVGGEDALSIEELLALIPTVKNSQERIVTKEDLLARVYTMPSNFGRVFRAAISPNSNNPLATQLYIISRDSNQQLVPSTDTLKTNIRKYLNSYRMISDAIDILDAKVINLQLKFTVVLDPSLNRNTILAEILTKLQKQFDVKKLHINQPLIVSDVINTIFTVGGVIAVDNVQFTNISGTVNNRKYSGETFDVKSNSRRQIILPPVGGIFEIRYPAVDIIAKVVN